MTTATDQQPIFVGVDTHADTHHVAVVNELFVPEIDADLIYPDRAVIVGMSGHPDTDHDCRCYALPYEWAPADGS